MQLRAGGRIGQMEPNTGLSHRRLLKPHATWSYVKTFFLTKPQSFSKPNQKFLFEFTMLSTFGALVLHIGPPIAIESYPHQACPRPRTSGPAPPLSVFTFKAVIICKC